MSDIVAVHLGRKELAEILEEEGIPHELDRTSVLVERWVADAWRGTSTKLHTAWVLRAAKKNVGAQAAVRLLFALARDDDDDAIVVAYARSLLGVQT